MASVAQIAANRLNAQEGTRTPNRFGAESHENFHRGIAEPIYRTRSVGVMSAKSQFHAVGNRSRPASGIQPCECGGPALPCRYGAAAPLCID